MQRTYTVARPFAVPASAIEHKRIPPPASLRENLKPLTRAQAARLQLRKGGAASPSLTLLDEVGRLNRFVPDSQVSAWRMQLRAPGVKPALAAQLRLQIGEVELAKYKQPEKAIALFEKVEKTTAASPTVRALARYDSAIALFYEGAYQASAGAFRRLAGAPHPLAGIDRRQCARWLNHAKACAGYHAVREKAGIREPKRLDPLCGAEAVAVALRSLKRPFDRKSVLSAIRVTGEGSNMQDLFDGAKKLGLSPHVVTSGPEGLKRLPMPLVSAVEHDHFVSVFSADDKGVTYLCSDCGAWPGGKQFVTWKQWKLMEAGPYMTLSLPGSVEDQALSSLSKQDKTNANLRARNDTRAVGVTLAGYSRSARMGGPGDAAHIAQLVELLKASAVTQYFNYLTQVDCGNKPGAQACDCQRDCPVDSGATGGGGGGGDSMRTFNAGPSFGDPINLATGEEEYRPAADLTVYNPIGPSVSLSRLYNSLRPAGPTYESDDFGVGWSHNYNVTVYDPTVNVNARIRQSNYTQCPVTGTEAPASGLTWDVTRSGSTAATSSSSNGWSVSLSGTTTLTVSVPSDATVATGYKVRFLGSGGYGGSGKSAGFDVLSSTAPVQVPQGGSATVTGNGSNAPASGLTWSIVQGSTTIATSAAPNGWSAVAAAPGTATTGAPAFAAAGSYELRTRYSGQSVFSGTFDVYIVSYLPKAGTRYLVEANGARIPIAASSVPSSGTPTIVCSVPAGYPLYVEWKYASGYTSGYYEITGADRSKMVTTTAAKAIGVLSGQGTSYYTSVSAIVSVLSQIVDNNGNAINFSYGNVGPSGFPLLASISDANNSALVTFAHDATTGGVTAISDRYSRSIYCTVNAYANNNVPGGWPQFLYEVDHVSRIVTTGTTSPPDRYAYGYQAVNNGENTEEVPFLHTITVPSPTGSGNATATINYATDGTCYVVSTVDANGNKAVYTPVANVSSTQVTFKDSANITLYQYSADFDANMSETGRTNGAGVTQVQKTFGDPNDPLRPSQTTNANAQTSYYTWDQYGNCLTAETPRSTTTTYTISYTNFPLGELTQIAQGGKTATSLTYYQPSGLIHTITAPKPGTSGSSQTVTSSFTYDSLGDMLTETGPGNSSPVTSITNTFNYTTDGSYSQSAAIHQPVKKTDNLGHVTHMRYDSRANLTAVGDALGNETDLSYNLANDNTGLSFAATGSSGTGHATFTNTYLYVGGPKTAESQSNESGTQVFQIVHTLGAEGEELARTGSTQPYSATLDALYRPVSISDGNSHATLMYYNSTGYAWKTVYPNGDTIRYTSFDDLGNPTQRIDGRSITTNYSYTDAESKLTDVQYPASTGLNVHLHYDTYGRLDSMTDGSGSHAYGFDDRDAKLTDTTTYTGLSAMTLTTSYNPDGSKSSLTLPDSTIFSYSYDAAARMVGLTNPSGQSWSWSYLNNNWLSQQNTNGQILTTPTRDARGFVTDLTNERNDMAHTLLSEYGVSYASNMTLGSITASVPGAPTSFSGTTGYTHDTKLQLTNETSTRGGGYNFSNAYDSAGNPTTFKGGTKTYNTSNQNTSWTHDGNGNPTSYAGSTLTFDAENRMTAYGSVLTAGYRADGLRAWKTTSAGTTYYLYDGDQPVEELDGSGTKTAVMTFGPGGVLARTTSSRTLLYTQDALGQMAQQIDASTGNLIASYLFDAWGARQVSTSDATAASDPYSGYNTAAGYITDWETGLQLLGHRYYDPSTGRFLNRDPVGMTGGVNVYAYVANSAVGYSDPSGFSGAGFGLGGLGGFIGGLAGCVYSLSQFAWDIGHHSVNIPSGLCELALNCALSFLLNAISIASLAPWLMGCITGAIAGVAQYWFQQLCNSWFAPCLVNRQNGWCQLWNSLKSGINGAIAGCIGGVVAGIVGGPVPGGRPGDTVDPISGAGAGGHAGGLANFITNLLPWDRVPWDHGCQ